MLLMAGCGVKSTEQVQNSAYTAVTPVVSIMDRVGGGLWTVHALVASGTDPHTFAMTPRMATELASASLYVSVGMEMDHAVQLRAPKGMKQVLVGGLVEHEEERDGELHEEAGHEHDPHLWLDPEGIVEIARKVRDAYTELDPQNAQHYADSCAKLEQDVADTVRQASAVLAPWKGRRFYVQHDAFTRFARYFGLDQVAVEEHDKSPSAARIAQVINMARKDGVRVVYAQAGHNSAPLKVIAGPLGARVASLDPLQADPVAVLLANAQMLAEGFAEE